LHFEKRRTDNIIHRGREREEERERRRKREKKRERKRERVKSSNRKYDKICNLSLKKYVYEI